MKNKTSIIKNIFFGFILLVAIAVAGSISSCHPKPSPSPSTADSGTFWFHLHTQVWDSTIGGNPGTPDSSAWVYDSLGRRIYLTVPQFFISQIMLVKSDGSMVNMANKVLLKGLDSEDYLVGKAPVGTYRAAMFTVGLSSADNSITPSNLFITDGNYFPVEASMWMSSSSGYNGMLIQGLYDTTATHSGLNPINFNFEIPNGLTSTSANTVSLPTRGTGAWANYPVYVLTPGGTQYVHVLCDYGKLMSVINLRTSYSTAINPAIADSLANNVPNMFRYEE